MDLPPSNCSRGGDAGPDTAFMLFGKQIKGPLPTKEIKEELSPRGVDETGVSLATSSDEEEDLNASVEATCEVAMAIHKTIGKRSDSNEEEEDPMQMGSNHTVKENHETPDVQWQKRKITEGGDCSMLGKQKSTYEENMCPGGGIEMQKLTNTERELKSEGEMQARKRQGGLWSRCPRCNSTDTKFCYFNNYNVNQPRHFCKHCQRYWTAGGTLRNVPVGAGKRKNKHVLRKEAFFAGPNSMASLDGPPIEGTDAIHKVESGPANVNADVTGGIREGIASEPSPLARMLPVNTELDLCAHQSTSSPMNTSCIQSQLTSLNTLSPLKPHGLPTTPRPLCSGPSKCSEPCSDLACMPSKARRLCLDLGSDDAEGSQRYECPRYSEISPNLADGRSKFSQRCASGAAGLSQIGANWQRGLSGLSQISADLRSGSSGSNQVSAGLRGEGSGLSQVSAGLRGEGSGLSQISADLRSGSSKRDPDMLTPESSHPQNRSCQPNPDELPTTDQKSASHLHESGHPSKFNSSFQQGLSLTTGLAQHNNTTLPFWDPNLWPYLYHMYWLDSLAFSHLKPILTPQGWATPFIPPNFEPLSFPTQSASVTLDKSECAHARSPLTTINTIHTCTIDTMSTPCATPITPTLHTLKSTHPHTQSNGL